MSLTAKTPDKYALQLMDVLFTDHEMGSSCFISSKFSTKPGLDPKRVAFASWYDDMYTMRNI